MPKIENWDNLPAGVRQLIDRMRDRAISIADLNQLRLPKHSYLLVRPPRFKALLARLCFEVIWDYDRFLRARLG